MQAGPKRNLKIRYLLLAGAVFVTIFAWSGGWLYMRGLVQEQIEQRLAELNRRGQMVSCPDMRIAGFPFRFEVSCHDPSMADPAGRKAGLKDLRVVALAYNPWHLIAEVASPARLEDPASGISATASWQTARSSVFYSLAALKQVDVVVEDLSLALLGPRGSQDLSAGLTEGHLRQMPGELTTLEVFASLKQIASAQFPDSVSPFDAQLHVQIEHGGAFLSGSGIRQILDTESTLPLRLVAVSIGSEDMAVSGSGDLSLDAAGLLSGQIELSLTNVEGLSAFLSGIFPDASPVFDTLEGAALSFGANATGGEGRQQVKLPLTLRNGRISVGILPLGMIPPIAIEAMAAGS